MEQKDMNETVNNTQYMEITRHSDILAKKLRHEIIEYVERNVEPPEGVIPACVVLSTCTSLLLTSYNAMLDGDDEHNRKEMKKFCDAISIAMGQFGTFKIHDR